jgi:hypothetical protein
MSKILLVLSLLIWTADMSRAQLRIGAEILSTSERTRAIDDDDPNDGFDNSFSVQETWSLVKTTTDQMADKLYISYQAAIVILDANSVLAYCKRRKKEKSYKSLYRYILNEYQSSDSLNYNNIAKYFTDRDDKYTPSLVEHVAEYFLKRGEVILTDSASQPQQTFFITSFETKFSGGVNFHLNDSDTTLFLHVNHWMR